MSINAMTVSAGQALGVLKAGWRMQRDHGKRMSWMMHGRPGIGKTQVAEALARHLGGRLYDIRLTQIDVSDLRGLPYYDHEARTTRWYRPEDLPADPAPAVLFLDEITAAPPWLVPTVYGLLQERRVGVHAIPDNVMIVAAGNTVDDGAVAYEMNTAVADRLVHMQVEASAEDWIASFAVPNDLHPAVTAFIKTRPEYLETIPDAMKQGRLVAATPRSWERVSDVMKAVEDREVRKVMIAGTVGEHVMADFMIVADDIAATVQVGEMIEARRPARVEMYPTGMYGLNALVFGLIGAADARNAGAIVEIMLDLGELDSLRRDAEALRGVPLKELMTYGFEALIGKLMDAGEHQALLDHPEFRRYMDARRELGLA